MPNHFHFFLKANDQGLFEKGIKNFFISIQKLLTKNIRGLGVYSKVDIRHPKLQPTVIILPLSLIFIKIQWLHA